MGKTLDEVVKKDKNKLTTTYPWVWLFYIELDDSDYIAITNNQEAVTFDSITYDPFPVCFTEMQEDSEGNLTQLTLTVSNIDRVATNYLENSKFIEKEVTFKLVNTEHLDSADYCVSQTFQILKATGDQFNVTFTLGYFNFFKIPFPRDHYNRSRCRFEYKSTLCGYAGSLSTCDKTLYGPNGCDEHDNLENWGGFCGIPRGRY